MAALMAYRVGVFDLALGVSAPEFTGELVVAKLVEQLGLDAPGELAGCRKKDRGRWKEEAEPEGRQLSRLPEVQPLSPSPNWRLRRYAGLGRFFEMPSRLNRYAPAISHPPLLPEGWALLRSPRPSGASWETSIRRLRLQS
jgi:hypothetical protein